MARFNISGGTQTWNVRFGTKFSDVGTISNDATITTQVEMNGSGDNVTITDSDLLKGIGMAQGNDKLYVNGDDPTNETHIGTTNGNSITLGIHNDLLEVTGNVVIDGDVHGGDGADTLTFDITGSVGGDVALDGGADTLSIVNGTYNTVSGGAGTDSMTFDGGTFTGIVSAGADADTVTINDGSFTDVEGNGGADSILMNNGFVSGTLNGGDGTDSIDLLGGEVGDAAGGNDSDTITLDGATVTANLRGDGGADSIDIINGSAHGVYGGAGTDAINVTGGEVTDTLDGGIGSDTISLTSGTVESATGGDDADMITLDGSTVNGTLSGGGGSDEITMTSGSSAAIDGNAGNDAINVTGGEVTGDVAGGDGSDTVSIDGVSVGGVDGGTGADEISLTGATAGDVTGGADGDVVNVEDSTVTGDMGGGDGNDELNLVSGEVGSLSGDAGDDAINVTGGVVGGDISGGDGSDTITLSADVGNVTIDGSEDADGSDVDVLDLSALEGTIEYDGANPENGVVTLASGNTVTFSNIENVTAPVEPAICFSRGMKLETDRGAVAVEDLQLGDQLLTFDHGLQPIRFIWSRWFEAKDKNAPVRFKAGSIGNDEDIVVSQMHRMYVKSLPNHYWFEDDVVVNAHKLVNGEDIIIDESIENVQYFHIMLDNHELVKCHGTWSESWQPHKRNLARDPEMAEELMRFFPEICKNNAYNRGRAVRFELVDVLDKNVRLVHQWDKVQAIKGHIRESRAKHAKRSA